MHMKMLKYMRAMPLIPPSPSNFTTVKSGILMSASLAKARDPMERNAARETTRGNNVLVRINIVWELWVELFLHRHLHFVKANPVFGSTLASPSHRPG